jgi:hypothetical protein
MQSTQPHLDSIASYLQSTGGDRRVSAGVVALVAGLLVLPLVLLLISSAFG